jgi:hypothetical protein
MSRISDALDAFRSVVPGITGFSDKTEIPNPYSLADNDSRMLQDGWGVSVGASSPSIPEFKSFYEEWTITVHLTECLFSLAHDPEKVHEATKRLMDDAVNLKKNILNNNQIGIQAKIARINLSGTSGAEFVRGDKFNILTVNVNFLVTITELIS